MVIGSDGLPNTKGAVVVDVVDVVDDGGCSVDCAGCED